MAVSLGEIKKMCKEKGDGFRASSLFGISKNDSGRYDFAVTTADAVYVVKVLTVGGDAQRVYFYRDRGYFTVMTGSGDADFMWVRPNFPETEDGKPCTPVLLLDEQVPALEIGRGSATTVTAGARVFDCRVYTPAAFAKLL